MTKITERLYDAAKNIWDQYYIHPFVVGIKDGTLPIEKFKYFMIQDYLYLFDYAKVFALGVVKSDSRELMQFFAKNVDEVLGKELSIHRCYMKKLGITDEEINKMSVSHTNKSYTSYMIAKASTGGESEILAAILACFWSYAKIGEQIVNDNPDAIRHELYGEWVAGYSSEEYKHANKLVMDKFDEICKDITEEKYRRLEKIFVDCSLYEKEFWDMSWNMEV